tara:strand:- start:168 stop:437 length:270 start_codon:yes stop_codon:yes gene_type:complete
MKKLSEALASLGLDQKWFDELKAEQETEKIVSENGLLSSTKEDVEDELNQLDVTFESADENDESEVDMNELSPSMKNVFAKNSKEYLTQ